MKTRIHWLAFWLLFVANIYADEKTFTVVNGTSSDLTVRAGHNPLNAYTVTYADGGNKIPPGEWRTFQAISYLGDVGIQWSCDPWNDVYPLSAMSYKSVVVLNCSGTAVEFNIPDRDDGKGYDEDRDGFDSDGDGSDDDGDWFGDGGDGAGGGGGSTDDWPCGMPIWRVSEPFISLWIHDEPLGYQPALGNRLSLNLSFKQREATAGLDTNIFSFGKKWNFGWFSYVTRTSEGKYRVHYDGGTEREFSGVNVIDYLTDTRFTGSTNSGFTVLYPGGSQDVYGLVVTNGSGIFLKAFLTERWDAQAQKTLFNYHSYTPGDSPVIRLQNVLDGDGRTNLIYYVTSNAYSTNLISQVVDPFDRTASFTYDSTGHLTNITDVAGLSSSLMYDGNDWVTNLATPYGTTRFLLADSPDGGFTPNGRSARVIEPDGGVQLFLYTNNAAGITNSYPGGEAPVTTPLANTFENANMDVRNSFHWGKKQYAALSATNISSFNAADFRKARMQHWLLRDFTVTGETISLKRDPSPLADGSVEGQKTWFDYVGKPAAQYQGTQTLPLYVAQVLPDTTTSFSRYDRNDLGNILTNISTYSTSGGSVALRTNTFSYDATYGIDLITATNALGVQVTSNINNAFHQVATNYDALNQETVYSYNGDQQLISVVHPNGLIVTNIYGADNWLATNFSYEVVGSTPVFYGTNTFTYANNLVLTHTNSRGLGISNTWDNLQRLLRVDFPDGTFITNTYQNLDLIRTVDRMGFTNSMGYDSVRRLTAHTNANGTITRYGYCDCGTLSSLTNAFGTAVEVVTQYFYDNQAKLTLTLFADGYTVSNKYDLPGRMTNTVDSAGTSTTNWFNNQSLVYTVSNNMGQLSFLTFDILDRITNSVDANGVTVTNSYDNLDRMLIRGYPDGGTEQFIHSVKGLVIYTNQLGKQTLYDYDARGLKVSETNANLEVTRYSNSPAGDLLKLTDGKIQNTFWNYNIYGLTTNKVEHTGTEVFRYKYDPNSRLTNRWTPTKGHTYYYYDKVANLTNTTYAASTAINMAYDALDRLTNMTDAAGTSRYTYNAASQLASEDGPWASDTVTFSYANRLRSAMSVLRPNGTAWGQTYGYDGAKRLTNTASSAGAFGYSYDATRKTRASWLLFPNSAYITNTYDGNSRLLDTVLKNNGDSTLNSHAYGYNVGNQRTNQVFTAGNYMDYVYDNIGQLTNAAGKESGGVTNRLQEQLGYAYDAAHNLNLRVNNALSQTFNVNVLNEISNVTRSGNMTVAGTSSSSATSVTVNSSAATRYADHTFARTNVSLSDGNNTFTAVATDSLGRGDTNAVTAFLPATGTYLYDSNGNLTSDGRRGFVYDDENQLTRVTVTNAWKSEFTYDGMGRMRVRKDYKWIFSSIYLVTNEVRYVYDGNSVVQERDQNNTPMIGYTRVGGLLARTDFSTSVAQPMASHAYYHADGNGNITALISTNQAIVAKYHYDPFGNILSQSGPLADANLYRFSSKEWHQNAGLCYYGRRFYDPNLQRWINRDPIGETGGANLYGYVGNNPISLYDPLGLCPPERDERGFWGAFIGGMVDDVFGLGNRLAAGIYQVGATGHDMVAQTAWSLGGAGGDYQGYSHLYRNIYNDPQSGPTAGQILTKTAEVEMNIATLGLFDMSVQFKQAQRTGDFRSSQDASLNALLFTGALQGMNKPGQVSLLPVKYDPKFAAEQLLGGNTVTPGGRTIMDHAARRMVNPPPGRTGMTMAEIDQVLDTATKIKKVTPHPMGTTVTVQHPGMPGKPQVVVDAATGKRVITIIKAK